MAFEIGQRVTSSFTGPGTVVGGLWKDEDRVCYQKVEFDNDLFKLREWQINKLTPLDEEKPPKAARKKRIQKEGGDGSQA